MSQNGKLMTDLVTTNDGMYEYTISNNEVTIVRYLGSDSNVIIPETIENYPVTIIGEAAFFNNMNLISISLSTVNSVEAKAFAECMNLASVEGEDVASIASFAFYNCKVLKIVRISKVSYLGEYCFKNCISIEGINIPLVVELPSNIFSNCSLLNNVDMSSVKTIGDFAFQGCKSLSNINIPEAINIDYGAFCYSGLKSLNFPSVEVIYNEAFLNCKVLEKVSLPAAKLIGNDVFMNSGCQCVDLPKIEYLGENAFHSCNSLKCICLSKNLSQIGAEVFSNTYIQGLTIDYGTKDISYVSEADWITFASKLTGIDIDSIIGRFIKNNVDYLIFSKGDTEAPVITLMGESMITLEVGLSIYDEEGAIVVDNSCEKIEPVISGKVDTSKIGKYILTYDATDSSGNKAVQVTRTVNVIDTTAPTITLYGQNPVTIVQGTPYVEEGAEVKDNSGEMIVPMVNGVISYNKVGQYIETYNATDSSGNKAIPITRTVNVIENSIISCSQIVCYNNKVVITKWALYTLDNKLIFISDNYLNSEEFILNLDTLSDLAPGTQFYVKAVVEGDDADSPVTLQYKPNSYTTYFELDDVDSDTWDFSKIYYNGVVDSDGNPPVIRCNKIFTGVLAWVVAEWDFLTMDGELLFTIGPYPIGNLVVLSEHNIKTGTVFKLKARVELGDDSYPYLNFLYDYTTDVTPAITLVGTAFQTCAMYSGLYKS